MCAAYRPALTSPSHVCPETVAASRPEKGALSTAERRWPH